MQVTEQELIAGCVRENRQCQQELFMRYSGKMLIVAMRYARHQMEAEDIVQESFIKVFDHISSFQNAGSFEGWIRKIVVNTALKKHSRKSFKNEKIGLEENHDLPLDPSVYNDLSIQDLMEIISKLPDGYKIVFNLYAIEGYSHKEISELLGIQESTSRSQLVKARKMLQDIILDLQKVSIV